MTEYDYSPEAWERFVARQNEIGGWVHHTNQTRPADPYTLATPAHTIIASLPLVGREDRYDFDRDTYRERRNDRDRERRDRRERESSRDEERARDREREKEREREKRRDRDRERERDRRGGKEKERERDNRRDGERSDIDRPMAHRSASHHARSQSESRPPPSRSQTAPVRNPYSQRPSYDRDSESQHSRQQPRSSSRRPSYDRHDSASVSTGKYEKYDTKRSGSSHDLPSTSSMSTAKYPRYPKSYPIYEPSPKLPNYEQSYPPRPHTSQSRSPPAQAPPPPSVAPVSATLTRPRQARSRSASTSQPHIQTYVSHPPQNQPYQPVPTYPVGPLQANLQGQRPPPSNSPPVYPYTTGKSSSKARSQSFQRPPPQAPPLYMHSHSQPHPAAHPTPARFKSLPPEPLVLPPVGLEYVQQEKEKDRPAVPEVPGVGAAPLSPSKRAPLLKRLFYTLASSKAPSSQATLVSLRGSPMTSPTNSPKSPEGPRSRSSSRSPAPVKGRGSFDGLFWGGRGAKGGKERESEKEKLGSENEKEEWELIGDDRKDKEREKKRSGRKEGDKGRERGRERERIVQEVDVFTAGGGGGEKTERRRRRSR